MRLDWALHSLHRKTSRMQWMQCDFRSHYTKRILNINRLGHRCNECKVFSMLLWDTLHEALPHTYRSVSWCFMKRFLVWLLSLADVINTLLCIFSFRYASQRCVSRWDFFYYENRCLLLFFIYIFFSRINFIVLWKSTIKDALEFKTMENTIWVLVSSKE